MLVHRILFYEEFFFITDQMYGCPEGWFTYQSNCYLIARNKTNWKGARSACRKEDADLVSINGEGEQDFLTSQIPSSKIILF